jgi:hypothetical protein
VYVCVFVCVCSNCANEEIHFSVEGTNGYSGNMQQVTQVSIRWYLGDTLVWKGRESGK